MQQIKKGTNQNHIILWFLNFDFPHEEITAKLDLQPARIAFKRKEVEGQNGVKKFNKHTFREFECKYDSDEFIGDVAERFVDQIIKPRTKQIKALADTIDSEFKIVQYYYA